MPRLQRARLTSRGTEVRRERDALRGCSYAKRCTCMRIHGGGGDVPFPYPRPLRRAVMHSSRVHFLLHLRLRANDAYPGALSRARKARESCYTPHATVTLEKAKFPNEPNRKPPACDAGGEGEGLMETAFPLALSSRWSRRVCLTCVAQQGGGEGAGEAVAFRRGASEDALPEELLTGARWEEGEARLFCVDGFSNLMSGLLCRLRIV